MLYRIYSAESLIYIIRNPRGFENYSRYFYDAVTELTAFSPFGSSNTVTLDKQGELEGRVILRAPPKALVTLAAAVDAEIAPMPLSYHFEADPECVISEDGAKNTWMKSTFTKLRPGIDYKIDHEVRLDDHENPFVLIAFHRASHRDMVQRHFEQHGVEVLPASTHLKMPCRPGGHQVICLSQVKARLKRPLPRPRDLDHRPS